MHSDTAANNFMNFSLDPGTGDGTQDPNELLSLQGGDGSVTIKAIRPASGDRTAILRIGDQNVLNQDGKCAKITSTSNDSNNEADLKFFSNNGSTSATEKMRINPNGTAIKKKYRLSLSEGVSKGKNPPLKDNDIVFVNSSTLNKLSSGLGAITEPISPLVTALSLFKLLQ